jgi:two-component system, LytTR family, sensor kinase
MWDGLPMALSGEPESNSISQSSRGYSRILWIASFVAWALIAFADSASMYAIARSASQPTTFWNLLRLPLLRDMIFAFLTPLVFILSLRYPLQKKNWGHRIPAYFLGGLAFSVVHTFVRSLSPIYGATPRDNMNVFVNWSTYSFSPNWILFWRMLLYNVVNNITFSYLPIVLIAHITWYYQRLRERELRASQLEAQVTKARLDSLRSQLQPHFLFNTLHSISALMLTDVHAADRMMTLLSDLLRMSLENVGFQTTTLQRELEFVTKYLEIEKVRFGDRLNVVVNVDSEALDAEVPHLLLQPLAENAVRHGIARLSSPGEIRIVASLDDSRLRLEVRDNGPGLKASGTDQPGTGLGLKATQLRLRTLYGEGQQFTIRNVPEGGVEVCVQIPLHMSTDLPALEIVGDYVEERERQMQGGA